MKKNALVTGCAKGIGREIALDLARSGYNIIATYNTSIKEINELKNKIESIGVKFDLYKLDLSSEDSVNEMCNEVRKVSPVIGSCLGATCDVFNVCNEGRESCGKILKRK